MPAEGLAPRAAGGSQVAPGAPRPRSAPGALSGARPGPEHAGPERSLADLPAEMLEHIASKLSGADRARFAMTSKGVLTAAARPLLDRLHDFEIRQHRPQGIGDRVAGLFAMLRHASVPGLCAHEQGEGRVLALWDGAVLRLHALPLDDRPAAFTLLRGLLKGLAPADCATRLATLLARIGDLPPHARGPLFTESLGAMRQDLPAQHRAAPLAALLGRVDTLYSWNDSACAEKLHLAISQCHAALMELPDDHRAGPLAALLARIPEFPADLARAYCQDGHRWVGELRPEHRAAPLAVLLQHSLGAAWAVAMSPQKEERPRGFALGKLPRAERERVLGLVQEMPLPHRAAPLAELLARLDPPQKEERPQGFASDDLPRAEWERALGLVQELPLPHRAAPLAELLARLELSMPDRAGEGEHGPERGLGLVAELPPEHQGRPLAALVDGLRQSKAFMTGGAKSVEVRERIYRLVGTLPPDQQAEPLAGLLEMGVKRGVVSDDRVAAEYERGQALVAELPSRHRSGPLTQLLRMIDRLAEDAQAAEFERGGHLVAELPRGDRDRPLAQLLTAHIDGTPHNDRTAWYEQGHYAMGMRMMAGLPLPHRTETLCVLLRSIRGHVPQGMRANEYQRGLRRMAELPLEQRSGPLHVLATDHEMLPPRQLAVEYERALHLVGLLPPDQRRPLAMTLASLLRFSVHQHIPRERRADLCVRSLHLVGENAAHRMNGMTRPDRKTMQWLLAQQPAAGLGHS
jgi:hypothetical protein